ncbi:hypothetical protein QBC41DRAFT_336010 [Cercophora samala]|uniref:Uncharacterized protein n=1 Tax=Cercophora samala TaxID=330535 RepID=A0AA39ZGD7_9PEZI|nr:hypothetical protein QBC41DRAFT_336010 [Cercophora samala]
MANDSNNIVARASEEVEELFYPKPPRPISRRVTAVLSMSEGLLRETLMFLVAGRPETDSVLQLYDEDFPRGNLGPYLTDFNEIRCAFFEYYQDYANLTSRREEREATIGRRIKDVLNKILRETTSESSFENKTMAVEMFRRILSMFVFPSISFYFSLTVYQHMEGSAAQLAALLCRFTATEMHRFIQSGHGKALKEQLYVLGHSAIDAPGLKSELQPACRVLEFCMHEDQPKKGGE